MNKLLTFLTFLPILLYSQKVEFSHQLSDIESQWHTIELNNEILSIVKEDFSDIRILSISNVPDTVQVPYFFKKETQFNKKEGVNFSIINQTEKNGSYYFTFKLKSKKVINKILLDFQQDNYNWEIVLEGSQDQKKWQNILKDYRILSIKNNQTDYKYTKLLFKNSSFDYYRIHFKSKEKPTLKSATLEHSFTNEKHLVDVENQYQSILKTKKKQSVCTISLDNRIPISQISFEFEEDFDFQRPINIKYLTDSFKTENGWKYNYRTLTSRYISSLEDNVFEFDAVFTNQFVATVSNYDNQALTFTKVETKRTQYKLVARFQKIDNNHFLTYGDKSKRTPNYDIVNFKNHIPKDIKSITIGESIKIIEGKKVEGSIFENKLWLWGIIAIIIALLGYSTLSMLKSKKFD